VRLPDGSRASFYGAKALADERLGVSLSDGRQLYQDYLESWLEARAPDLSEGSVALYRSAARVDIEPVIGSVKLNELTPQHIQRVFTKMRARGLKTVRTARLVMNSSLEQAARHGLIVRNPVSLVSTSSGKRGNGSAHDIRSFQVYDAEQAQRYLDVALSEAHGGPMVSRYGVAMALILYTGLRQGEMLALRWRDVVLSPAKGERSGPYLQVVASGKWRQGDFVIRTPKTFRSRRRILLVPQAVEALQWWRAHQKAERLQVGAAWQTRMIAQRPGHVGEVIDLGDRDGLVFANPVGRPLHHNSVRYVHRKIASAAGAPLIRVHDLRHTFATLLLLSGANVKVVSEALGHASEGFTLAVYSHVLPDMQASAMDSFSRLLAR
jgi:integrase